MIKFDETSLRNEEGDLRKVLGDPEFDLRASHERQPSSLCQLSPTLVSQYDNRSLLETRIPIAFSGLVNLLCRVRWLGKFLQSLETIIICIINRSHYFSRQISKKLVIRKKSSEKSDLRISRLCSVSSLSLSLNDNNRNASIYKIANYTVLLLFNSLRIIENHRAKLDESSFIEFLFSLNAICQIPYLC